MEMRSFKDYLWDFCGAFEHEKAGDDSEHNAKSLRLLHSCPDLVRIAPFYEVPGKVDMLSIFAIACNLKTNKLETIFLNYTYTECVSHVRYRYTFLSSY